MQTAFVPRPLEHGPHQVPDLVPDAAFDIVATDFMDLARQLST
jgi:2-haloacid dehalogenase